MLVPFLPKGKSCSQCGSVLVSRNGSLLPSAEAGGESISKEPGRFYLRAVV
jgi:hypothetical protein